MDFALLRLSLNIASSNSSTRFMCTVFVGREGEGIRVVIVAGVGK